MQRVVLFLLAFVAAVSSVFMSATAVAANAPSVVNVLSRKVHGAAGTFNLSLAATPLDPTTEPRAGPAHTIVFVFDKPVVAGVAAVTEGAASAGSASFAGNEMAVPLTSVGNQQYVTITVSNVTAADGGTGGSGSIRIGFLTGDANQNRNVSLADLIEINKFLVQTLGSANYRADVNVSGTLTIADMLLANAQLTLTLPSPTAGGGGGGGTWNGVCPGFTYTRVITLDWANPTRMYTTSVGTFASNDALVVKFTTGSAFSNDANLPRITAAEYQTSPSTRVGVLSKTPCDFSQQPGQGANLQGTGISMVFAVGASAYAAYYPVLQTNTTYYLNIKNEPGATCTMNGACDMFIDLIKSSAL